MAEGMAGEPEENKLAPLAPQSLGELAYGSIRDSIVSNRFRAGERLVETRLADELGISRAPVREALRRLAEEGLVVERPRHGVFVREFTASDFVDIYNLRIAIETAAIRLLTRRGAGTRTLQDVVDRMRSAARRGRVQELVRLELGMHQEICRLSGNTHLASVFRSVSAQIQMALSLDDAEYASLEDIVAEHVPLIEAIESGDEDRAAAVLHRHILATVEPVLARLGGSRDDLLPATGRG
jgi:DNA-binding GntR family transcriptional regulator